ncbi:YadA-like family protein [Halomonas sp. DP4Y7-1]|nr:MULTISPECIES: YadA-like family protein [unclassified Halomonas]MBY5923813.1 YadA-like family protein [Halomonas sp. DP4Y7-2]MBY6230855.1 YadA-like family protein [Halomonas sp. DP4Y7-1]
MGGESSATGAKAVAIGEGSTSSADGAVSLGSALTAGAANSVVIGTNSSIGANAESANAIGDSNTISDASQYSSVLGMKNDVDGNAVRVLGNNNDISADFAGVAGSNNTVSSASKQANVIGNNASVDGLGATVVGSSGIASADHTIVIGTNGTASALEAVAIGHDANASEASSIALGSGTTTETAVGTSDTTVAGTKYTFAGTAPKGTVSVGSAATTDSEGNAVASTERTITHVAAGRLSATSTDAVNGSQLHASNLAIDGNKTTIDGHTAALADLKSDADYYQANSTGAAASATGADSLAMGPSAVADKANSVAIGNGAKATVADSVALGNGATTAAILDTAKGTVAGTEHTFAGGDAKGTVSVGAVGSERTITNVAAGQLSTTSTDAVNGSQLYATNQEVDGLDGRMDTAEGNVTANKALAEANKTSIEGNTTAIGGNSTAITDLQGDAKYYQANSTLNGADASGTDSLAMGPVAKASATNSVAIGNGANASVADSVALGNGATTAAIVDTAKGTVAGTEHTFAGGDAKGTVSVGAAGSERTVTNVAAGQLSATSTDAVNGSQLYATNQEVDGLDGRLDTAEGNITANKASAEANKTSIEGNTTAIGGNTTAITDLQGDAKYYQANSTGAAASATGTDSLAMGPESKASATNSVAIGNGANASVADSVALGNGATTAAIVDTAKGTVAGTEHTFAGGDAKGTVSVGTVGSERTVTNVAAGQLSATSTDAVNGSQLYATNTEVAKNRVDITTINDDIGDLTADAKYYQANSTLNGADASGTDSLAMGPVAKASASNSVAIGNGANASIANSVALGNGATTETAVGTAEVTLAGTKYDFAGTAPTGTVSVGTSGAERTITNVAAGRLATDSTDAVNGSQLYATNQAVGGLDTRLDTAEGDISTNTGNITTNAGNISTNTGNISTNTDAIAELGDGAVQYDRDTDGNVTPGTITLTGTTNGDGDTIGTKITNLANGDVAEGSRDAVSGDQLWTVQNQLDGVAGDSKYYQANSTLNGADASGTDSLAMGPVAKASATNSVAIGNGANASIANSVALGNGATTATVVDTAKGTVAGTEYTFAGGDAKGTVSVGTSGAERTITHVAAGRLSATSTDAVNGSQLYATNQAMGRLDTRLSTAETDIGTNADAIQDNADAITLNTGNISTNTDAIAELGDGAVQYDRDTDGNVTPGTITLTGTTNGDGDTIGTKITNLANGDVAEGSRDAVSGDQLWTVQNQLDGVAGDSKYYQANSTLNGADASGIDSLAMGPVAKASATNSVAIGSGANASVADSVALGNGATTATVVDTAKGTVAGTEYTFAGGDAKGTVSVGTSGAERTITNVAAGRLATDSTDAVNGSQLYATNQAVGGLDTRLDTAEGDISTNTGSITTNAGNISTNTGNISTNTDAIAELGDGAVQYDRDTDGTVTPSTITLTGTKNGDGDNIGTKITNLANGDVAEGSRDAVSGDQLWTVQNQLEGVAGDSKYYQANSTLNGADASGIDSLAMGPVAKASATNSVAIGSGANASVADSVALGNGATTATVVDTAKGTVAGTEYTFAGGDAKGTVSVGTSGAERTITHVAAGRLTADSTDAVNGSQLYATNQAVGGLDTRLGTAETDIGTNADAIEDNADAITLNTGNISTNTDAIVELGDGAVQYDRDTDGNVTPGTITLTGTKNGDGDNIGTKITNLANGDVAEGSRDAVSGDQLWTVQNQLDGVAGDSKYYQANSTLNGADASGTDSLAMGPVAKASASNSVAIGNGANASIANSVALGNGATTETAVGTAEVTLADNQYDFAGKAPTGTVSVGTSGAERTITHVAAGRLSATSTDAVNGSQLYATNQAVGGLDTRLSTAETDIGTNADAIEDNADAITLNTGNISTNTDAIAKLGDGAVQYDRDTDGNVTPGTITLTGTKNGDGDTIGTKITNLANGDVAEGSRDAVSGDQLWTVQNQLDGVAGDSKYYQANSTLNGADASGTDSLAMGPVAKASATNSVAIGNGANASIANSVALGNGATTETAVGTAEVTLAGTKYDFAGTAPTGTVSVGTNGAERTITHVAAGRLATDSTDAVNGSQLYATNQAVDALDAGVVKYDLDGNDDVDTDSITLAGGADGTKLSNVAEGNLSADSTDAVNGSQLYATNQAVGGLDTRLGEAETDIGINADNITINANAISDNHDDIQDNIEAIGDIEANARYYKANSTGDVSVATGVDSLAMGPSASAMGDNSLAIGKGASVSVASSVALGSGAKADRATAPVSGQFAAGSGVVSYNTGDGTLLGEVSVGQTGEYRQVTHVADGVEDHDAVTLRQLKGAIGSLSDTNALFFHANGIEDEDSVASGNNAMAAGPGAVVNADEAIGVGYQAKVEASAAGAIAIGDQAHSSLADAVTIGSSAQGGGEQSVALGAGAKATQAGAVALGAQSVTEDAVATDAITLLGQSRAVAGGSPLATVSVGAVGKERTLTHLAAGRVAADSTDAINGSQLFATHQAMNELVAYDRMSDGSVNWGRVTLGAKTRAAAGTVLDGVADGKIASDSKEAINGSQLKDTNDRVARVEGDVGSIEDVIDDMNGDVAALADNAVQYDADSDKGQITLGGTGGTLISNVADGSISQGSSEAVNGGQIWDLMEDVGDLQVSAQDSKYFQANSSAPAAQAKGDDSIAIGGKAVAESKGGVALGSGAIADREGMNGKQEAFSDVAVASSQGALSVGSEGGERQITHVAGGTEDTDAVNVRQLKSVQEGAVNYDRKGDGSVDYGSVSLGNGGEPVQIHNVASGTSTYDAVNLGQLNALDSKFSHAYDHLSDKINEVERDASGGIAALAAMADAPYVAGKFTYHIGTGYHNGESALGVSLRRTADDGRWSVGLGIGASHGGPTVGLGVSGVID